MPTRKSPRKGSLQYWPRKRASKFLPRVNWEAIDSNKQLQGFICYKAGMKTALVQDNSPDSMTKGKEIAIPVTILECPPMKILSIRFYKYGKVADEYLVENLDKELKRKIKIPKKAKKIDFDKIKEKDYDDVSVIIYSVVKNTNLKKKPDLSEVAVNGDSVEEKLKFIQENINKELNVTDFFEDNGLVDLRGLTKGKGTQGPVRRFGITLKGHKSEKGRRRPGSLGPWHPARVIFRVPMAGQLGKFTRITYNSKIIKIGNVDDFEDKNALKGIKKYGDLKTNYIVVNGSVQGPSKRQLLMTPALRASKKQSKKNYELKDIK